MNDDGCYISPFAIFKSYAGASIENMEFHTIFLLEHRRQIFPQASVVKAGSGRHLQGRNTCHYDDANDYGNC